MNFVGRARELALLRRHLDAVKEGADDERGRALLLRGRRRVGKSRLVEVFCEQAGVPWVFFTASKGASPSDERDAFVRTVVEESDLPDRSAMAGISTASWAALLRQLALLLPADKPSIVVLDEVPYLMEGDSSMEGALQTAWDRYLSKKPILLVLVGSDLAVMKALGDYKRPFHQRAFEMILPPLTPFEVGEMLDQKAADAFDSFLVTGGLPLITRSWKSGYSLSDFLRTSFEDPTSALIVSGERILSAGFPRESHARRVLTAIGGRGERTFSGVQQHAGTEGQLLAPTPLSDALASLTEKRVVAVDEPLSTKGGKADKRYRVADPFLRFWLTFVEPSLPFVERGRADVAVKRWRTQWATWRGRAIEPVVREALERLLPNEQWPDVEAIGGWWPRNNNPEVDLVGADRSGMAKRIYFVGSIKWHEKEPFSNKDLRQLAVDASHVPGVSAETPLVGVGRVGVDADGLASQWTAEGLIKAWHTS